MKAADKGKDATVTMKAGHQQLQFLETGEVRQYYDHKRFGLGLCYYRLKDDSLQLTWVQKDDSGRLDTFQMERLRISIQNDTLRINKDEATAYYKRESRKPD